MLATAVGAIPVRLGVGLAIGLFNGLGVAFLRLRVPSMIFMHGANAVLRGLMVVLTGGFAPQNSATPPMI